MVNIVNNTDVTFSNFLFDEDKFKAQFRNYVFSNNRFITKSMITWWAYTFDEQPLFSLEVALDIEHIFSRNRQQQENSLKDPLSLEMLGNKSLLERRINIRASDYRFEDKRKYYLGFTTSRGEKPGTDVAELKTFAKELTDYTEQQIKERSERILDGFVQYLKSNNLVKNV